MSAKFLHVCTEESPELQKQMGCITGIFQMFDRQHLLTGRRITGHNQKRHSSGHGFSRSSGLGTKHVSSSPQIVLEKNLSKSITENQRISMESSRTSFSSSSCSSFSSLEYNKSTPQEPLLFDGTIFSDKYSKNSPRLKTSNADGRPPRYEPNASVQTARRSLAFKEVVKESINRDPRGLSVKTSHKQEVKSHALRHRDSPRPVQVSRPTDGSNAVGINGKSREPVDISESIRGLVKRKEAPRNFTEFGESPRMSFEGNASSLYPVQREAHRFSYDGREISRQSLDSPESAKLSRELPRLSLDSRQGSQRNSNFEMKPTSISNDLDGSYSKQRVSTASNTEQELVGHKRATSVVAKLMGLEAMPSLSVVAQDPVYSSNNREPMPLHASQGDREDWLSSPKRYIKGPDSKMKPISNAKVPTEPAPWRQQEEHRSPQKAAFIHGEAQVKQKQESVYSEVERRLNELEFQQSNKDLRVLKQILDAMQAKGLFETKKGDHESLSSAGVDNQKTVPLLPAITKGSSRTLELPIVIMKPVNSVKRSGLPSSSSSSSSVIRLEGLSGIQKVQTRSTMDRRKTSANHIVAKERVSSARIEDSGSQKVQSKLAKVSSRPQQSPRENGGSSLKTSGSLSPRLQQKRLEAERSRPAPPSLDSSKPRRPSVNRKSAESVSPRNKLRHKPAQVENYSEQLIESSETRSFSCQSDEISQRSDSNLSLSSQLDIEVTSAVRSADNFVSQQGSTSPSGRAARKAASVKKLKKPLVGSSGKASGVEFVTAAPEQPSPISVLDASFYQDDLLPFPSKKNFNTPQGENNLSPGDSWTPSTLLDTTTKSSSSEINRKKLRSIENLVQKLSALSSTDNGPSTTDHIASLCETQNPDHRYVSEILLASGLLLKDLSAGPMGPMPIQLHPSGHPINPDLFLVLEQTKTGWLPKPGTINDNTLQPKVDQEKLHRKLLFDTVNEVLIEKLELTSPGPHSDHFIRSRKLACRFPSGQQLLKELCLEIEKLQANIPRDENCDVEIKMSDEEVLRRSEGWTDFDNEAPGVVLEIERLVFKDLIDEIVCSEAVPASQSKASRRSRQLFTK